MIDEDAAAPEHAVENFDRGGLSSLWRQAYEEEQKLEISE
jgi:hypothetical protein